jgi:hypothetical protein
VIRAEGEVILTDPPGWLLDTTYATAAQDPYLRPGYYHPMSYYGGAPGVQFASAARVAPCSAAVDPNCKPETCSFYSGIHLKLPLQLDCLNDSDFSTCVGVCAPAP